jgi:DNA polymerase-3 subunit epsilon
LSGIAANVGYWFDSGSAPIPTSMGSVIEFPRGVVDAELARVPLAIVDLETTGLYPGDRIVEIAIVRVEPGSEPVTVVDTLVNPGRPVTATEIHGITDADVADAPTFREIVPVVLEALSNAVFASYNVYFDGRFVREELRGVGISRFPPQLCLMHLRPMLGLGERCSLGDACEQSGVAHSKDVHRAAADAVAAAALWARYLDACERSGIRTFRQLAGLRDYKFTSSFGDEMLSEPSRFGQRALVQFKTRSAVRAVAAPAPEIDRQWIVAAYHESLRAALADLHITPNEIVSSRFIRRSVIRNAMFDNGLSLVRPGKM